MSSFTVFCIVNFLWLAIVIMILRASNDMRVKREAEIDRLKDLVDSERRHLTEWKSIAEERVGTINETTARLNSARETIRALETTVRRREIALKEANDTFASHAKLANGAAEGFTAEINELQKANLELQRRCSHAKEVLEKHLELKSAVSSIIVQLKDAVDPS